MSETSVPETRSEPGFSSHPKEGRIFALVGNPNSGKTTIFNALTGLRQKVGNYPGVTVERKEGIAFGQHGEQYRIIDLPGAYSLNAQSPDEEILRDVLLGRREDTPRPDTVICVIDASNAERHLYLATQILELGLPAILVLNMSDIAESKGDRIDPEKLSAILKVPVIPTQAHKRVGIPELRIAMSRPDPQPSDHKVDVPVEVDELLDQTHARDEKHARHAALYTPGEIRDHLDANQQWEDILINARYEAARELCIAAIIREDSLSEGESGTGHRNAATVSDRLDSILLHRFGGWFALLSILGLLFFLIFSFAEIPMGWIESLFASISGSVESLMPEGDLRDLIVEGAIAGVEGVIIFLPQILILFFFIGLMEDTGYLSRVAFILDRLMSRVGLHGRSFVPLLSAHACAVPAIMGTRTIENPKDRLITILVAPFAGCTARLPVYLLMIAVLVPNDQVSASTKAGYLIGLYGLGIAGIIVFSWAFSKVMKKGVKSVSVMELPGYKAPSLKAILIHMWERSWIFVRRAGTIILGISILIWAAENYPKTSDDPSEQLANSYAGKAGQFIEPVIEPLGYDWKIGIGVIASFAAREVFVSAMAITYNVEESDDEETTRNQLRDRFRAAERPDGSKVFTPLTCLSLLVFYVFALQCASTIAIVRRETNSWRWPIFQFVFMTATAYVAALAVYQGGKLMGLE